MVRTKLVLDNTTGENKKYKSIFHVLDQISRKEGFLGYYKPFLIAVASLCVYKVSYNKL